MGNGVIGGGGSGFGSVAYTNGSETANISLMANAMTIPGISEANAFFFGDNILVGSINQNNIFDYVGWVKGTSVFIDGASSAYTAKGDLYLSNSVPEPATMAVLGCGMLGAALKKRKRESIAVTF